MDYHLSFTVNGNHQEFDVKAKNFEYGKNINTFDPNLFSDSEMLENGYVIRNFPENWYSIIKNSITNYIKDKISKVSNVNLHDFSLEYYHKFVDDELHKKVINFIQAGKFGIGGIHLDYLGIPYEDFDTFVNSEIGSQNLSCHYKRYGLSLKHFWVRIIRPNSGDNNPPHKDVHVKRINRNVNIYLPLAGSNENSSLPILPKSHLETDDNYIISSSPYYVNGKKFSVNCIVYRKNGLDLMTPNPKPGEIMIFTPHLIHGGGVNLNRYHTRVSLEMRFFL